MEEGIKFFVGLDVHKDSIEVAIAEAGRGPGRLVSSMAHNVAKPLKLLAAGALRRTGAGPGGLRGRADRVRLAARAGPARLSKPGDCPVLDSQALG